MTEKSNKPIVANLWISSVTPENYGGREQYYEHLMDQYKIFVEMADRTSVRRNQANTFFLTLHTFTIGSLGFLFEGGLKISHPIFIVLPLIALLMLCYVWWRLVKSYRQLNQAKYKIIGEFEQKLPSSPYWIAEWDLLGKGKEPTLYKPLTDLENWVPIIFGIMYLLVAGFLLILP